MMDMLLGCVWHCVPFNHAQQGSLYHIEFNFRNSNGGVFQFSQEMPQLIFGNMVEIGLSKIEACNRNVWAIKRKLIGVSFHKKGA